jgi:thiol-disulfide isomerase/thioredoxin
MLSIVKTVFAGLLVGPCMWLASSAPTQEVTNPTLTKPGIKETPGAAPDFTLPDLKGQQIRSADLKGRVVVLDFWATWCEPCIADIPIWNRLYEKYGSRGLKVVGIAIQSGWADEDIKPFVAKHRMKYTILVGNEQIVEQYSIIGLPTTYLIGKDWTVVKKYIGTLPGTEAEKEKELQREIERLLETG